VGKVTEENRHGIIVTLVDATVVVQNRFAAASAASSLVLFVD